MRVLIKFTVLLLLIISCSKEPKIKLNSITQTDENCNVIGEPDLEDWNLTNFNSLSTRDEEVIYGENGIASLMNLTIETDLNDYKLDCIDNYNFNFLPCPNPVDINSSDGKINFNISTDLDILTTNFSIVNRKNEIVSGFSGGSSSFDDGYFYPNYGDDFTLYYIILTTDSCAFYGKGDIMVD